MRVRERLRAPLERAGIVLVNGGLSGDTTADLLRRLDGVVALEPAPALVITLIGGNDVQRHGPGAKPLVSAQESIENLRTIRAWLSERVARLAWTMPPPVDEAALARAVAPRPLAVRNTDLRPLGTALHGLPDPVVDTAAVLGDPPDPALLETDALHPSPEGQAGGSRPRWSMRSRVLCGRRPLLAARPPDAERVPAPRSASRAFRSGGPRERSGRRTGAPPQG